MSAHHKKQPEESNEQERSIRLLKFFCGVVGLIIVCSLIYRTYFIFKHSKFDGNSGFIVTVTQHDDKKAKIYVFDPKLNRVGVISVDAKSMLPNVRTTYKIPIDGEVRKGSLSDDTTFPLEMIAFTLYNPTAPSHISLLDSIRLWWLYRSTPDRNITVIRHSIPDENVQSSDLENFFIDSRMQDEKQTISIINGTAIPGLGGRLDTVLSNIGGNVISVSTAHESLKQSKIIYYGEETYTVKRLSRLFMLPTERREEGSLSDIMIELGDDVQRTTLF